MLSDCANEWYDQLYQIQIDARYSNRPADAAKQFEFYERNRLVLPKYLRALEVLEKYSEATTIVAEAKQILSILTVSDRRLGSEFNAEMCKSPNTLFGNEGIFLPTITINHRSLAVAIQRLSRSRHIRAKDI
jgi:hypothetical protein